MKLTAVQIDQLYKFTRDHYVEHYDLQTELVDHLANGIEKRWESNPTLSFEDALNLEFKEFGIFGFNDVIEKHNTAFTKKYFKIILCFMREYIRLPKIIKAFCAILLLFCIIRYVPFNTWIIGVGFVVAFFYFTSTVYKRNSTYKAKKQKTGKRWKLEEMIFSTGTGGLIILNLFQIIYHLRILSLDYLIVQFVTATMLVFAMLFLYISIKILPEKAEELLRKTYPAYELSE